MKKVISILMIIFFTAPAFSQNDTILLLVGTYTHSGKSEGIYIYHFDSNTGDAVLNSVTEAKDPSFLAITPDKNYVYSVNELGDGNGSVSAYKLDSGKLHFINTVLTQGDHPCHISIDSKQKHAFVSNYSGGNLSVFTIQPDGSLSEISKKIQYTGNGPNKERQNAPHIHSAFIDKKEAQVYVQDLGTDKIFVYDYKPKETLNYLVPNKPNSIQLPAGSGPRHVALSESGEYIYALEEMSANISVIKKKRSEFEIIQTVGINADGFSGENGAADIKISPDGRFLYATNRGDANTIAVFAINTGNGLLEKIETLSVKGKGPRNFNITPNGKFLLVANQTSNEIVIFERDLNTGKLTDTEKRMNVGAPVCLVF